MAFGKKRQSSLPDLADLHSNKKSKLSNLKRTSPSPSPDSKAQPIFCKLIDTGVVAEHEIVSYLRKRDQSTMKAGRITRHGVVCTCCDQVFLLSKFEVHAGSTLHRPSTNMFLKDGRSIAECLLEAESRSGGGHRKVNMVVRKSSSRPQADSRAGVPLRECNKAEFRAGASRRVNMVVRKCSSQPVDVDNSDNNVDNSDNYCQVCGYGGELMLCDTCPSAFHAECLHLNGIPDGDWCCARCRCGACGMGAEHTGRTGKTDMVSCAQCHVYYHEQCVDTEQEHEFQGNWLCGTSCRDVFRYLRSLVGCVIPLEGGLSWMLLRSFKEDNHRVMSLGKKTAHADYESKIASALCCLQESFDPIVDPESEIDLLTQTAYNKKADRRRLDCRGFYTVILLKMDELVSVANVRVHGTFVAEMPFIATQHKFRQQGMCRTLIDVLKKQLRKIGVERLVLPSMPELLNTWTGSFGFAHMSPDEEEEVCRFNLMTFPGTTLLEKRLTGFGVQVKAVSSSGMSEIDQDDGSCISELDDFNFDKAHPLHPGNEIVSSKKAATALGAYPITCH